MDIQEYIQTEHSGATFERVFGRKLWKKLLGSYCGEENSDEALELDSVQRLLLYGPFAVGKTLLLQAQAGEMISAGYQYLEVDLKKAPEALLPQICEQIVQYCTEKPCYLYLDHIEALEDGTVLWELSGQVAENGNYLIMAAAAEDETKLNPEIRKLFNTYYVGLPDAADREAYLKEVLDGLFEHSSMQGMFYLVEETEGYNYVQLNALIQQIKMRTKFRILAHEITIDGAMKMLNKDILEEVMSLKKPPEAEAAGTGGSGISPEELTAILQTVAAARPAAEQAAEQPAAIKRAVDPLEELRAKFAPDKVFDQGVYLTKAVHPGTSNRK